MRPVSSSSGGAWPSLSSCSRWLQCACGQAISLQPLSSLMASTSPTSRPFYFSHLHTRPFARPASPKIASNTLLSNHCHTSFQLSYVSMGLNLIFRLIESSGTLVSPLSYRLSAPHGLMAPNTLLWTPLPLHPPCLAELLDWIHFSIFPLLLDHCRWISLEAITKRGVLAPKFLASNLTYAFKTIWHPFAWAQLLLPTAFTDQAKLSPLSSSSETHLWPFPLTEPCHLLLYQHNPVTRLILPQPASLPRLLCIL